MSFVGGLAGKIVAKYAFRFKAAYRLGKQLKNLAGELIDGVREWKGARKALDEAKAARKSCNSFAPGTGVLLADGSRKPIEKIKLGDLVVATDPKTGRTVAKAVTRLIAGEGDKNLVRITIDTDGPHGNRTGTVVATAHHPFWTPQAHRWVDATDLQAGQWVRTSAGTWVQITSIRRWTEHARVHNLTIDDLHTYYVFAGNVPVLSHNVDEGCIVNQTLGPDKPSAGVSAERGDRVAPHEQRMVNEAGDAHGCSTCPATESGYRDGHWTGDHQPPNKLAPQGPWTLYPQCQPCARQQGGIVNGLNREWYDFD